MNAVILEVEKLEEKNTSNNGRVLDVNIKVNLK
jgi:hypothetical protein